MSDLETKRNIENVLKAFTAQPLKAAATGLFNALGYAGKKTLDLDPSDFAGFCAMFDLEGRLVELVDEILATKRSDPDANVSTLEAKIDNLVSRLYGQTPEKAGAPHPALR